MLRARIRSPVARRRPQRKAEAGNPREVGAPMPGTITTVAVSVGRKVARGDVMATLEAMKMENELTATRVGTVTEVAVGEGTSVEAGRLLVVVS